MVDPSAKFTPAKSPKPLIYNSDTVYSTTTFRPVSPSPLTPPAPEAPSPKRTRKLETPLHFDGGLFSDIRSTDGKLLSKVTVDQIYRSTRHDVTDSPSNIPGNDSRNYVDDIVKTETITNEDVIKVKFTPVPPELDTPPLLRTPPSLQKDQINAPIEYIKDNFEDLQSYKLISSICKETVTEFQNVNIKEDTLNVSRSISRAKGPVATLLGGDTNIERNNSMNKNVFVSRDPFFQSVDCSSLDATPTVTRMHSPLASILLSEQLQKLDTYLQSSLDVCTKGDIEGRLTPSIVQTDENNSIMLLKHADDIFAPLAQAVEEKATEKIKESETFENKQIHIECKSNVTSDAVSQNDGNQNHKMTNTQFDYNSKKKNKSTLNSVKVTRPGVLNAIYNMPIHYHAAILCLLLIVYNLIYQYIKQNCNVNTKII